MDRDTFISKLNEKAYAHEWNLVSYPVGASGQIYLRVSPKKPRQFPAIYINSRVGRAFGLKYRILYPLEPKPNEDNFIYTEQEVLDKLEEDL